MKQLSESIQRERTEVSIREDNLKDTVREITSIFLYVIIAASI